MTPQQLQDRVLFRDGLILVIDKPAGLPVHAGPGGGPNLERHFDALRFGLPRPPALAHRLDRDTSGCLVLGRHPKALRRLGMMFAAGKVDKTYWAVTAGEPPAESGRIDLALAKHTRKTGWIMVADPQGQAAITDYQVMGRGNGMTWLALFPRTGRTHQIRVHGASIGCPLLGDPQYGGPEGLPLHLLSRAITLPLYPNRDPITVHAPVPAHMRKALAACGWNEATEE
jgi:tRNA pseudouridine32 synthase/23S rRNA pseudouridine746 synthase/23S rRNA pseudouridine1911/1915/1917 synthase